VAHHHKVGQTVFDLNRGVGGATCRGAGHPHARPNHFVIQALRTGCAGDDLGGGDLLTDGRGRAQT
ncbi:hypothetical protein AB4255_25685, partial [Vibrio sp. 10N.261.55.E12]|uniref:hypothetical protein n=1 Tax=unclassified Vibrio TaxID=2614977 RepID=UPI00354DE5A3